MRTLNLGILAHVDAGKTSLTERLLEAAGVIEHAGSVDAGDTQTDSLALERQRGITIKAAVVSFSIDDLTVNLIDTPGHPDFIAEVERALDVLDGAVLVISAVEGVQSQTRVLMRALQRLRIPTLIFVNKVDRRGAAYEGTLQAIAEKLTPALVPMATLAGLGGRTVAVRPLSDDDPAFRSRATEVLTEHDEALLAAYVGGVELSSGRLVEALVTRTARAEVHPVFFGSAVTGAGVGAVMAGIARFLPATDGDAGGPLSGAVFKVERAGGGEKVAFARLFGGTLRVRDRVRYGDGREGTVTSLSVFESGGASRHPVAVAGQIAAIRGLADVRIGDAIGAARRAPNRQFAPPTLETVVVPRQPEQGGALRNALVQLDEQDPLINLRRDERRGELLLSLYGEVQIEVLQATLADEYGVEADFRETTMIHVERPVGTGSAVEIMRVAPNPFLATVGLRVERGELDSGVSFDVDRAVLGTMPLAFFKAIEDTVEITLGQGLRGWRVTDCRVTLTHTGYSPRQSHAHQRFSKSMSSTGEDFRGLTPLVLMQALRGAGTVVCEPVHRFELELPGDAVGPVLSALSALGAVPGPAETRGSTAFLEGDIPAAGIRELQLRLAGLTRGEGVLECTFDRYEPVRGDPPVRPRTDFNPLDRDGYLLHVLRRV